MKPYLKPVLPGLLVLFTVAGCSGSTDRPATYPVSGTVMYNGNPITGATVAFWGEGASKAATGVTDSEGKFTLSMFEANDGAVAGTHKITVTKSDPSAPPPADPDAMLNDPSMLTSQMQTQAAQRKAPKDIIPARYKDRSSTTLTETVSADGENVYVLQLVD